MTDIEISKALALAIGHRPEDVFVCTDIVAVVDHRAVVAREFDYMDWTVIAPIAEKFDCFPGHSDTQGWFANIYGRNGFYANTPQKAIALAVIGDKK